MTEAGGFRTRLGIPNQTVGEFLHDFIGRAYGDVYGIDPRIFDIANGMIDFAETGDWHPAIDAACDVVTQYLKVRDEVEGERVVQAALGALLFVGHGPYLVRHELEATAGHRIGRAVAPRPPPLGSTPMPFTLALTTGN